MRSLRQRRHDWKAAQSASKRAEELLEALVEEFPQSPEYRFDLAETYATWDEDTDPHGPAGEQGFEKRLARARKLLAGLVEQYPNEPVYTVSLAKVEHRLARYSARTDRLEAAIEAYRRMVTLQSSLVRQFPKAIAFWEGRPGMVVVRVSPTFAVMGGSIDDPCLEFLDLENETAYTERWAHHE